MRAKEKFVIGVLGVSALLLGGVGIQQQEAIFSMENEVESSQMKIQALSAEGYNLHKAIKSLELSYEEEIENLKRQINDLDADLRIMQEFYKYDSANVRFDASNIKVPSGATVYHLKKALYGTDLYDLAETYVIAEKEYGVNAIALAALTAHEATWGTSSRALNDNNYTGYAVYSDSSPGASFSSASMNILRTAELLETDYLAEDGKWYNGLSLKNVNTKYCYGENGKPDYKWSESIEDIAYDLMNQANK